MPNALLKRLGAYAPAMIGANPREKLLGSLGVVLGLLSIEWLGFHALGEQSAWFIAPIGATAVLLFATPTSPLAQPWSVVGGNVVSALVGVLCAHLIPDIGLAAAAAVAAAVAAMFALRCLHPPGGAVALTAVLGGPAIAGLGYGFAIWPVGINSLALVCIAGVYNGVLKRRHASSARRPQGHGTQDAEASARLGFTRQDLDDVLREQDHLLTISREDLEEVVMAAEQRASVRRFGEVHCADIMSRDVVRLSVSDTVDHARTLFSRHRLAALPVLDEEGRFAGMLEQRDVADDVARELAADLDEPSRVGDYLHADAAFAVPDLPAVVLARPMSDGLHCVPVLDEKHHVVGIVTQSDLVAALYRMTVAGPNAAV